MVNFTNEISCFSIAVNIDPFVVNMVLVKMFSCSTAITTPECSVNNDLVIFHEGTQLLVNWYIGTMGFSYSDWKGVFYPSEMPSRNYLAYYSRIFKSVEIDSTFYGTPRSETILRWKSSTPDDFKFSLKTPRVITHESGLVNVDRLLDEFLNNIILLDKKLAVILLQFPPSFTRIYQSRLLDFISQLPEEFRFAVEVRDASWYPLDGILLDTLKSTRNCWASTEYPGLPRQINPTSDFHYMRWIGKHGSFMVHNRERYDRSDNMRVWQEKFIENDIQPSEIFGFFNNDYSGYAVASANRYKELIGVETKQVNLPKQGRLF